MGYEVGSGTFEIISFTDGYMELHMHGGFIDQGTARPVHYLSLDEYRYINFTLDGEVLGTTMGTVEEVRVSPDETKAWWVEAVMLDPSIPDTIREKIGVIDWETMTWQRK